MNMHWTCDRPHHWTGRDGVHVATAVKMREGIIHSSEWMWVTKLDGEWVTNADTLKDAKAAVAARLNTPHAVAKNLTFLFGKRS
jgi:hypothetical protein